MFPLHDINETLQTIVHLTIAIGTILSLVRSIINGKELKKIQTEQKNVKEKLEQATNNKEGLL